MDADRDDHDETPRPHIEVAKEIDLFLRTWRDLLAHASDCELTSLCYMIGKKARPPHPIEIAMRVLGCMDARGRGLAPEDTELLVLTTLEIIARRDGDLPPLIEYWTRDIS